MWSAIDMAMDIKQLSFLLDGIREEIDLMNTLMDYIVDNPEKIAKLRCVYIELSNINRK